MAKEDQTQQETSPVNHEKRKGSLLKWIIIGVVGIAIVAGGIVGGFFYLKNFTMSSETQKHDKASVLWPMEPFIVNLADTTGDRYLKAVIQLEVSGQENTAGLEQLKPKFRDCVLDILSSKSYRELMEMSGKQRLREDIAFKLNSYLSDGKIVRVYFTEFVIQ